MSLDFRVTSLPYKSSSFATPEGALFLPLYDEQLKLAQGEEPLKLPPPGEVPPQAGIVVYFHGRSPVCMFFLRAKGAVVWFYNKRRPSSFKGRPPSPPTGGLYTAAERLPQPSARRAVKLKNPPVKGRSNLRTLAPNIRKYTSLFFRRDFLIAGKGPGFSWTYTGTSTYRKSWMARKYRQKLSSGEGNEVSWKKHKKVYFRILLASFRIVYTLCRKGEE